MTGHNQRATACRWLASAALVAAGLAGACVYDPVAARRGYLDRGDRELAQGHYQQAVNEYRQAVELDRRSGVTRQKLAAAYDALGDPRNALLEYTRASDLLLDDVGAQLHAGDLMLSAGQLPEARTRALRVLRKHAQNLQAQILLAHAVAGLDRLDRAMAQIERAVRIEGDRTTAYPNLSEIQYIRGDRRNAEGAFRRAAALDDSSVDVHLALANYYWTANELDKGQAELTRALALAPRHDVANRAMALFLLANGGTAAAEPYLKTVVEVTDSTASRLALADYYLTRSRIDEALATLAPLTSRSEAFVDATLRIGRLELLAGRGPAARQAIAAVLAKEPNNAIALTLSARQLLTEGQIAAAFRTVAAALAANSTVGEAHLLLGALYEYNGQPREAASAVSEALRLNPTSAAAKITLARLQLVAGATDTSAQLATQAAAARPDDLDARLLLVRSLLARGDAVAARRELAPLLEQTPRYPPTQVAAGLLAMLDGDAGAARIAFGRALDLDPQDDDALAALLSLDLVAHEFAQARSTIERRLEQAPDDPRLLTLAARVYRASGDAAQTEHALRRLIDIDPSSLQAYGLLARLYQKDGRLADARGDLEALAHRRPDSLAALTMLGAALQLANQPGEAKRAYEAALKLDPNAAVAANNLAWLYATNGGNLDLALELAQTAKARLADSPEVDDTIGWIYYKRGLTSLAVDAFGRSVAREPDNVTYVFHLGLAYAQNNDRFLARQTLERALRLQPQFEGADEARTVLASVTR